MTTASFWEGRKVLLTGHTGFTGMWVSLWLATLGARVTGCSLRPSDTPSFYDLAGRWQGFAEHFIDLRNPEQVDRVIQDSDPEIVLHLAAQPLVGVSIEDPVTTFSSNIQGTVHLLSSLQRLARPRVILVITSDKVYANLEKGIPFREGDMLGGDDPYSASKACVELVVHSWRESFVEIDRCRLATARLGNVIGGGDWARDRLVPDYFKAVASQLPFFLRSPRSTRPWQHVLDVISGYLRYAEELAIRTDLPTSLNIGPIRQEIFSTGEVVDLLQKVMGNPIQVERGSSPEGSFAEKRWLHLDARLACSTLAWRPRLALEDAIRWTADWYRAWLGGSEMAGFTRRQIEAYRALPETPEQSPGEPHRIG